MKRVCLLGIFAFSFSGFGKPNALLKGRCGGVDLVLGTQSTDQTQHEINDLFKSASAVGSSAMEELLAHPSIDNYLRGMARARGLSDFEIDDVRQEVALKLLKNPYVEGKDSTAFIKTIIFQRINVYLRSQKYRGLGRLLAGNSPNQFETVAEKAADPAALKFANLTPNQAREHINHAIDKVERDLHRNILRWTLEKDGEPDYQGSAQHFGCSVGTYKTHLHRARARLKEILEEEGL